VIVAKIWENPVTRERAGIVELPYNNQEGRVTAELTALVGARVMGEHRHPALVERFTVLEGELTVKLAGQTSVLRVGKTAIVEPGVWHDWWNASDRQDARVRVEVTPGERFAHMIRGLLRQLPGKLVAVLSRSRPPWRVLGRPRAQAATA
jgi:quercetin dioxygenase-like cupin family protein